MPVVFVGTVPFVVYRIDDTPEASSVALRLIETPDGYQAVAEHGEFEQLSELDGGTVSTWISAELTGSALPAPSKERYLTLVVAATVKADRYRVPLDCVRRANCRSYTRSR